MIKIRKPRIDTIIIISMIIFVCIIGFYFTSRVIKTIFFEENTAKSSFDEIFVDENDSIVLESLDLTEDVYKRQVLPMIRCLIPWNCSLTD